MQVTDTEKATLTFDTDLISLDQISQKVTDLGYTLVVGSQIDSSKKDKLERLEKQRQVVAFVFYAAAAAIIGIIWSIQFYVW